MLIVLLLSAIDWLALARDAGQGKAVTIPVHDARADVKTASYPVVAACARATKDPALVEILLPTLSDPDPETRAMAARALAKHGARGTVFVPLLSDPDWRARVEAIKGALADETAIGDVRASLLSQPPHVLLAGLEASFKHASRFTDLYERLYARADDDADKQRAACLALFGALKAGREVYLPDCANADWRARLIADAAEQHLGVFDLSPLWKGAERHRAFAAAAAVYSSNEPLIEAALRSNETSVLAFAADALSKKPPLAPKWAEIARSRLSDPSLPPDARIALSEALSIPDRCADKGAASAGCGGRGREFVRPRDASSEPSDVRITTNRGVISVRLAPRVAPNAVASFLALIKRGYFNNTIFHRVVPDFVVQGGDPTGTGVGGPDYLLPAEPSQSPFFRGAVGVADAGPGTGGSQFFIMHSRAPHLERRYTWIGWVTGGMDVVDRLQVGDIIISSEANPSWSR